MYIGAHVSISGGYLEAAKTALQMRYSAFQYFAKNPRSLSSKTSFNQKDAEACARFCRKHGLISVVHSAYPINLAGADEALFEPTVLSLLNDLQIAEACGSVGVVVHFGKYKGTNPLPAYQRIIRMLENVLMLWEGRALLLLENQAGEGTQIGTAVEELVQVQQLLSHSRKAGFCFDTCHAFASGIWTGGELQNRLDPQAAAAFVQGLKVIHLNDSKYAFRARRDRHAPVGEGEIGLEKLKQLVQMYHNEDIAIILETPESETASKQQQIERLFH